MKNQADDHPAIPPVWLQRTVWGVLFGLLAVLLCAQWHGPDIFTHLSVGKQILSTGWAQPPSDVVIQQPHHVNIYWLFQVLVFAAYSLGGVAGISLLFMAVWMAAFVFWARTANLSLRPAFGLPWALATIVLVHGRFDPRPEVFSFLFLSLQLYWLSTWKLEEKLSLRRYALFAASEALWANMHGYFVLGPLLLGGMLALSLPGKKGRARVPVLNRLLGLAVLATFVSPLAFRNWQLVAALAVFYRQMHREIFEFLPPTGGILHLWVIKLFWVYWGSTLLAALFLLTRRRGSVLAYLAVVPGLWLSATGVRGMPLLIFLGAPLMREFVMALPMAGAGKGRKRARTAGAPWAAWIPPAATGLLALACALWAITGGLYRSLGSETRLGFRLLPSSYPEELARYLNANAFSGRIFNDSIDGAYLEFACPATHCAMNSFYVDAGIVRDYFSALHDPAALGRLDNRYHFDGLLFSLAENPNLFASLLGDPGWKLVYADLYRAFMVSLSGSGKDLPVPPPRFCHGDDLTREMNDTAAIEWIRVLAQAGRRDLLLEALGQYASASRIPPYAVFFALQYGAARLDREVFERAHSLLPRMAPMLPAERAALEQVLPPEDLPGR